MLKLTVTLCIWKLISRLKLYIFLWKDLLLSNEFSDSFTMLLKTIPRLSAFIHRKIWWRHQMETFSALLAICAGNSPVAEEFPHTGQLRGALMFLTCAPRRSIVLQFFWHVDTRPISPFLFFFYSTFYLCIIIVIFYLMYLIH